MTSPIDINPGHLEIIQDILHKNLPSGVTVWVFGSRANWSTKDSSDLDLALEGDYILDHNTIVALEVDFEESNLPYKVDVIDINQVSNSFRHIVEAHKILLARTNKPRSLDDQWSRLKFGDCAALIRDTILPTVLSNTPYVGLEHIGEGTLSLIGCGNASDVSSIKGRFRRGDILFGKLRPYFRKIVRADFDGICSTDIWVVRPTAKIDADFLFYTMTSKKFIDFATRGSEGTKMPRAKWEWVSRYDVPIPPFSDQRAISHILRALDDKIKLNRRMNQTLERMARALFKSWFVDFDPVRAKMDGRWRPGESLPGLPAYLYGMFPDGLVDSELGLIPERWMIKHLGDVSCKPQYGYTASAVDKPIGPKFLRITDINKQPWVDWNSVPHCIINKANRQKYQLWFGDILISRIADPGHGCMIESEIDAVFASYLIRFRPRHSFFARFLQYWLKSDQYWCIVNGRKSGTTRNNLNAKTLSNFPLIVPSSKVCGRFSTIINSLRSRIVINIREIHILEAQRDILLPKLLSGDLRVPCHLTG